MSNRYALLVVAALVFPPACSSGGTGTTGDNNGGSSGSGAGGSQAGQGGAMQTGGSGGPGAGGAGTGTGGVKGNGGASGATGAGGMLGTGGTPGAGGSSGPQKWVGTWTASPYYDSGNQPPASMTNALLRQVVHASLGGSQIRVQFSNLQGNGAVTINSAHVATCGANMPVNSTIVTSTDTALAFSGKPNVTIAAGQEVWSDMLNFTVANQGNVTITIAFGTVPTQVVGHSGSRTTSYLQAGGTNVSAASVTGTGVMTFQHWYYISGMDVMADMTAGKGIVAIGDSITDGRGTDNDMNNRWTDILAMRLQGMAATAQVSTMNQGIGATNLIGTSGTAAQARFKRDVLGQSGVRYAIVFDGVNDIGGGASAASVEMAYMDLISRARAAGLLIYGATITPFGGNAYYTTAHEMVRQQVNTFIRSGAFDGVIDFDMAVADPANPTQMLAKYAQWSMMDGLHPGPLGYMQMGDSIDPSLFTK
jgi:lysophospholipase L1-like esterase